MTDLEEDRRQRAFQDFMLAGTNKTKQPLTPSPSFSSHNKLRSNIQRQYASALQAFYSCLVKDWIHTDQQLHDCVASLANLRQRVHSTSRALEEHTPVADYMVQGFRRPTAIQDYLARDDLQLALTEALLAHERMMATSRRLAAVLSQAQEALGRRMDELLMLELPDNEFAGRLNECRLLYVATSQELYRKQQLLQKVFESVHDGVLYRNDNPADRSDSPKKIAKQCAGAWSRDLPVSCLYAYNELIQRLVASKR